MSDELADEQPAKEQRTDQPRMCPPECMTEMTAPNLRFALCKQWSAGCNFGDKYTPNPPSIHLILTNCCRCHFAHSNEELTAWEAQRLEQMAQFTAQEAIRPCPAKVMESRCSEASKRNSRNFVLCKFIMGGNACKYGESCSYAHSEAERAAWTQERDHRIRYGAPQQQQQPPAQQSFWGSQGHQGMPQPPVAGGGGGVWGQHQGMPPQYTAQAAQPTYGRMEPTYGRMAPQAMAPYRQPSPAQYSAPQYGASPPTHYLPAPVAYDASRDGHAPPPPAVVTGTANALACVRAHIADLPTTRIRCARSG